VNVNTLFYRILAVLLGTVMMSFAWPVRGQFGHEWGAAAAGALAGAAVTCAVPWKSSRRSFAQAAFFGILGFVLGGENIPYGATIDYILQQPSLASCIPQLLSILFTGASWGCIGATYLGYALSEKPLQARDYLLIIGLGVAALIAIFKLGESNAAIFITFTLLILVLQAYNFLIVKAASVTVLGLCGLLGFGLGFLGAVVILYYGDKGLLPGPADWWTLRDQMWGGAGGMAITLGAFFLVDGGKPPFPISSTWFQRLGFAFFGPGVCAVNTWNVYTKWFQSPPAPDMTLAGILILGGSLFLFLWLVLLLVIKAEVFSGPGLNPLILACALAAAFYLAFFAIAKSIVYSGWGAWETAFTLFVFDTAIFLMSLPFMLLGRENQA